MTVSINQTFGYKSSQTAILSIIFLGITPALTGCGQKGALYLPTQGQSVQYPAQANQTQKGHKQDDFLVPKIEQQMNERIMQNIEQMNKNPNDY